MAPPQPRSILLMLTLDWCRTTPALSPICIALIFLIKASAAAGVCTIASRIRKSSAVGITIAYSPHSRSRKSKVRRSCFSVFWDRKPTLLALQAKSHTCVRATIQSRELLYQPDLHPEEARYLLVQRDSVP